jgi:Leucine-rich repeat (LRR) protein
MHQKLIFPLFCAITYVYPHRQVHCVYTNPICSFRGITIEKNEIVTFKANHLLNTTINVDEIRSIQFENSSIYSIPKNLFTYFVKMERLDMSYTNVKELTSDGFSGALKLRDLNLGGNSIAHFPRGLPKLEKLNLEQNFIETIPSLVECPSNLKEINLKNNKLRSIVGLQNCKSVTELLLSENLLRTIPKKFFDNMKLLAQFSLHKNKIEWLFDNQFEGAESLTNIELSENKLRVINEFPFHNMFNLTTIHLEKNNLEWIHRRAFGTLIHLEFVYLFENKVEFIHREHFLKNSELKIINLDKNHLKAISDTAFSQLYKLWSLNLTQNHCIDKSYEWKVSTTAEVQQDLKNCSICDYILLKVEEIEVEAVKKFQELNEKIDSAFVFD